MIDTPDMIDDFGPHGDDLLAAELVMNLLEAEELAYAHTRQVVDPAFATLVVSWQERLIAMTDSIDPVAPPKRVKKKLLKQMFAPAPRPLSERLWVWKGLSFAAIALAAYMGIQQLGPEAPQIDQTIYASQLSGQDIPLLMLAVFDPARGDISIGRVAGDEAEGRAFELWAIVPDAAPVSLGVLPATDNVRVALPDALRARVGEITLAISDEPTGGSPTGAPTGAVLAASPLIAL